MAEEKLFSLDAANALIPQMEMAIEKIQRLSNRVRSEICGLPEEQSTTPSQQSLLEINPQLRSLFEEVAQTIQAIEKQGGVFKGLELGLVDFPAVLDGEKVYLCWQYGEKEIAYCHARSEGFSGRRALALPSRKPQYYQ